MECWFNSYCFNTGVSQWAYSEKLWPSPLEALARLLAHTPKISKSSRVAIMLLWGSSSLGSLAFTSIAYWLEILILNSCLVKTKLGKYYKTLNSIRHNSIVYYFIIYPICRAENDVIRFTKWNIFHCENAVQVPDLIK